MSDPAPTVRVQPDGYLLELGRDGQKFAIATMACRSQKEGEDLAESLCANMRTAYWWRVFPVIFGDPSRSEDFWKQQAEQMRAQMRAAILSESQPPRDLAAPADSPEPSAPQPAPEIKPDPGIPPGKPTLPRGPGDGVCLNCGERVSAPITCTAGEAIFQVAWCAYCGAFHDRDDSGWSVATVMGWTIPEVCRYCECPKGACACVGAPEDRFS